MPTPDWKKQAKWKKPARPDRDRMVFEVLHHLAGVPAAHIARRTYVSASTVNNWRSMKTRYPQAHTLAAVAKVAGLELRLVDTATGEVLDNERDGKNRPLKPDENRVQ